MPEPQTESAPRPNRIGRWLGVAAAAFVLVAGIAVYLATRPARLGNVDAGSSAVEYTLPLDTFVVNLSGSDRSYLRAGIAIGLSHAPAPKEDVPIAQLRDTIVSILSAAKPEEIATADGKAKLKSEVLQALRDRAPGLGVQEVYFTEFLVQQ